MEDTAYCGQAPLPGALAERWNFDPVAIAALAAVALLYALARGPARSSRERAAFAAGLAVVAVTVVSPLCAFAVALFSARMAQHLLLVLVAAPLLVLGRLDPSVRFPRFERNVSDRPRVLLGAGLGFAVCWWFWHAPVPYDAALRSSVLYAAMQLMLLASAFSLWRALLGSTGLGSLAVGLATAMQMGLLGALLTFAPDPLYARHLATTSAWGLSALEDQQLAGLLCWVPGCGVFLLSGLVTAVSWLGNTATVSSTKRLLEVP